jgi:hypothetical protein
VTGSGAFLVGEATDEPPWRVKAWRRRLAGTLAPPKAEMCRYRVTNRFDVPFAGLLTSTLFGFQSSSMVERAAVNRDVVGSSPTSGAII